MQLFRFTITDLMDFDTPPCEEWLPRELVPIYAEELARTVGHEMPDLLNRGMCLAMYDSDGQAVSIVPLDVVQ
jgi:hypothetical protein